MRLAPNSVLEGRYDVPVRLALLPFPVPAVNFLMGAAAAERFQGRLVALRLILVMEEPAQDLESVRIGLGVNPFLQGANHVVADMRSAQFLAPLVDLVEGFGVAHAPLVRFRHGPAFLRSHLIFTTSGGTKQEQSGPASLID
jgi:hypothetical protein